MTAFHQASGDDRRALRAHLKRYGIERKDLKRLRSAFAALVDLGPSISAAEEQVASIGSPTRRVTAALRLLIDGPSGEFWS